MARNILFICSQNKWRSPTAEHIFANYPNINSMSAGLNHDAETPITPELLEWADTIFVMEKAHKTKLSLRYKKYLHNKKIICLNIPDNFKFMDEKLVALLLLKVKPFLH
ncbi:MAG: phosphotyrosine protein phosphatase [Pseudomonadota bacterium]